MPIDPINPTLQRYFKQFFYGATVSQVGGSDSIGLEYSEESSPFVSSFEEDIASSKACQMVNLNRRFRA